MQVLISGFFLLLNGWSHSPVHDFDRWPGESCAACVGMDSSRLAEIDTVVRDQIAQKRCPGAVVLVNRMGRTVWWRPYGVRLTGEPQEPMSRETVFDMASLTKVMATATSVMVLIDRGAISLGDRVTRFIPEFGQNGKETVTIEQLLRHRAGFVADNSINDYRDGPPTAFDRIWALKPIYEPDSRFLYTDVGYITLGEIVRRVSGNPLDAFARENVFEPLLMCDTTYRPDGFLRSRTAPTERRDDRWMRGDVHDPRAWLLGGVAGHAGLFSTAADTLRYAQMVLGGGELDGRRVLSRAAVMAMTSPGLTVKPQARGLGWDVDTSYSSIRGDLFEPGGFGHTGFTGTSLWIDPASQTVVVILTNRVHPDGKGDVRELRRRIATIVAGSIQSGVGERQSADGVLSDSVESLYANLGAGERATSETRAQQAIGPAADSPDAAAGSQLPSTVLCGIDRLARDEFRQLRGRKIGLITNHTGVDREGRATIDLLHHAKEVSLVALFSPEHGIRGQLDAPVGDSRDEKTGLPVYSLYQKDRRKPTAEQLRGIDTLVFDIQDIGCRFYTYSATLGLTMESAAKHKLKYVVLDRPNPIGGELVEGPLLDPNRESFTGYHPIPVRHGMTLGELARLYRGERNLAVDLEIVPCEGWQRAGYLDATGLMWVNPSPNMRSLRQAVLYPGIGLLETTNLSVGRGTETPFEVIGAPWLDGRKLVEGLATERLPGVVFVPTRFTPTSSVHTKRECGGVQVIVTDREAFRPVLTGLAIARQLRLLYRDDWQIDRFINLLANREILESVRTSQPLDDIRMLLDRDTAAFERVRAKYLQY